MKKRIYRETLDLSTDASICNDFKFGKLKTLKPFKKARNFHAKGKIVSFAKDFRTFGLECIQEEIKGLKTPPNVDKINFIVHVNYADSILLRHWIKVGDIVNLDLVYYLIYKDETGDELETKISYRNFL